MAQVTELTEWISKLLNRIFNASITTRGQARPLGILKGTLEVGPEFFEPLPTEELDAWGVI
jgi:hypothetical protein